MKITKKILKEKLNEGDCHPDQISELKKEEKERSKVFLIMRGFFYTHGRTSDDWKNNVRKALEKNLDLDATFIYEDSGEVWKSFRGGASVRSSSHWYVKLRVNY